MRGWGKSRLMDVDILLKLHKVRVDLFFFLSFFLSSSSSSYFNTA